MKALFLSVKLVCYGLFCDMCADLCTKLAEYRVGKNKPLTTHMLAYLSNLANNSLSAWRKIEMDFIRLSIVKEGAKH